MSKETEKQELQQQLTKLGVEYNPDDSRVVLREAIAKAGKGGGDNEGMVSVPSSLLKQMQIDIHNLKSGVTSAPLKRITTHTARVKMHNDKYPVVGITKVWVENKGRDDETVKCQLVYLTGKTVTNEKDVVVPETKNVTVQYLDFLNEQMAYKVSIVKQDAKEVRAVKGMKAKINPDPKKMGETGEDFESGMVEDVVRSVIYTSTVKFLEGPWKDKEIRIKNEWLNL